MNKPLLRVLLAGSLSFGVVAAYADESEWFDDRFYIAPMGALSITSDDAYKQNAFGGSVALGKSVMPHLGIELQADFLRYRGETFTTPGTGPLCGLLTPCPDQINKVPDRNANGVGLGLNLYVSAGNDGLFLHADAQGGDRFMYNGGLGLDVPLFARHVFIRAEALYHKEKDYDGEALFRLGLRIPFGSVATPAVAPAEQEPVQVVPVEQESAGEPEPLPPSEVVGEPEAPAAQAAPVEAAEAPAPAPEAAPAASLAPAAAAPVEAPVAKKPKKKKAAAVVAPAPAPELPPAPSPAPAAVEPPPAPAAVAPPSAADTPVQTEPAPMPRESAQALSGPKTETSATPAAATVTNDGSVSTEPAPAPRESAAALAPQAGAGKAAAASAQSSDGSVATEPAPAPRESASALKETAGSGAATATVTSNDGSVKTEPAPAPRDAAGAMPTPSGAAATSAPAATASDGSVATEPAPAPPSH